MVSGHPKIFAEFREWLQAGGYSHSSVNQYSVGVRLALGFLDKPHHEIDPEADLARVRDYLAQRDLKSSTLATYHKGLAKLAQYLRYRRNEPEPERVIDWDKYLTPFSPDLANDIRAYIAHRSRAWKPEQQHQATLGLLSHLAGTLRGLNCHTSLTGITPTTWLDYVEQRLQANIQPSTLNRELYDLQDFLRFVNEEERPICERMLAVEPLGTVDPLPRDVPIAHLRQLLRQIEQEAHKKPSRQALMDKAWFSLMLYSGLRTSEVRHLRLDNLDLEKRLLRIRQGKGLQDRIVFLSREGVEALEAYLAVRGPATTGHVFVHRHKPLGNSYCQARLRTYGQRCGLHITPHRLRYSCATLFLNAGTPILTVQRILGHQNVETTLRYARLYEQTVVDDYRRAMRVVEGDHHLPS